MHFIFFYRWFGVLQDGCERLWCALMEGTPLRSVFTTRPDHVLLDVDQPAQPHTDRPAHPYASAHDGAHASTHTSAHASAHARAHASAHASSHAYDPRPPQLDATGIPATPSGHWSVGSYGPPSGPGAARNMQRGPSRGQVDGPWGQEAFGDEANQEPGGWGAEEDGAEGRAEEGDQAAGPPTPGCADAGPTDNGSSAEGLVEGPGSRTLFVSGFGPEVDEAAVRALVQPHGAVARVTMKLARVAKKVPLRERPSL